MDEENKLPLKRVEFSLSKFNEVAIPHHLDLLRQHKANIIKYEECGELARARTEQRHARRVAAQLRALLLELEALRRQVREQDRARFDSLTQRSRDTTLRAIVDYLGLIESSCRALVYAPPGRPPRLGTSPLAIERNAREAPAAAASAASTDSVGVVAHVDPDAGPFADADQIQLRVDDQELALREREALLRGWSELQAEVRALHDVWQHAQAAALAQREQVAAAAGSVDAAADNVGAARGHLASAERLRAGAYGVGGACVGALVGGPVGLCVGAKAGALAAAAGSLLGYVGAKVLGRKRLADAAPAEARPADDELKDKEQ
ncbi:syntaxin 17 isoform X3 [Anticarsia gemmatalis]|uniref:syntaxin 17 isoform X3 n=1 Tax=Anticarsia gemmatalis TaxID=129554 RepID=UPI003F7574A1